MARVLKLGNCGFRNGTLRYNSNKMYRRSRRKTTKPLDERSQRRSKQMARNSAFMNAQDRNYKNVNSPQTNRLTTAAKSLQSYSTLCDPIDGSPPGSPVPGILQARTLEWVAISFSNAWKWKVKWKSLSCVWLLVTPWTAAYQDPPSMGFSRQEYWSGVPMPSLRLTTNPIKSQ